ncbi:S-layer homology domain-containing protein [Egicoccus sp. AB-alg6-2]|uniref:S-layer homology domain-containing protein n=1 Tax=Egicoccus sp. AB-alg6-2 TaxID=3242692 RepID=UPI00359DA48A
MPRRRPARSRGVLGLVAALVGLSVGPSGAFAETPNDATTPTLESMQLASATTLHPLQRLEVAYRASDVGSGVRSAAFVFTSELGHETAAVASGTAAATGPARVQLLPGQPGGTYRLTTVSLTDAAGNTVVYERDGRAWSTPSGAVGPTRHTLRFADLDVTYVNPGSDTTAPELQALTRTTPERVRPGDPLSVSYTAIDTQTGVNGVVVLYENAVGRAHHLDVSGPAAAHGPVRGVVGADWADGAYRLVQVTVHDGHNLAVYLRDGRIQRSPTGLAGPTTHALRFADADFTVDNPSADTTAPDLTLLRLSNGTERHRGESLWFQVRVADGGSGVALLELTYADPLGNGRVVRTQNQRDFTAGSLHHPIPQSWPHGSYRLENVRVVDAAGNGVHLLRDGGTLLTPAGITGPARHSLRLADLDFRLVPLPGTEPSPSPTAPTAPGATTGLRDVTGSHAASITAVVQAGIASGYPDGTFRPGDTVTRAQLATFLARALNLSPVADHGFTDVGGSHAGNIGAVARAGITTGYPDRTFRPDDTVTRAQMASFLARALELRPVTDHGFTDVAGAHAGNIGAVARAGITTGYPDRTFRPDDTVTRAQMASFLARALDLPR